MDQSEQVCQQQPPARWPPLLCQVQLSYLPSSLQSPAPTLGPTIFTLKVGLFDKTEELSILPFSNVSYTHWIRERCKLKFIKMNTFSLDVEVLLTKSICGSRLEGAKKNLLTSSLKRVIGLWSLQPYEKRV